VAFEQSVIDKLTHEMAVLRESLRGKKKSLPPIR
jgi:hypothetical protein